MDALNEMYLWHGWWPPSDEDSESRASTTGSAETRFSNDRRLAMETIKSYAEGAVFFHNLSHTAKHTIGGPALRNHELSTAGFHVAVRLFRFKSKMT